MKLQWIHKIETSSICNLKCSYCPNPKGLPYGHENMSEETFDHVCYWVEKLNPTGQPQNEPIIWLHGIGEPLLNPNIISFVEKLSKLVKVGFSTNGILLTEEIIKDLDNVNLSHLTISRHNEKAFNQAVMNCHKVKPKFKVDIQSVFNDDWAGQITSELPDKEKTFFHCAHIETGGAHVLWNGNIINCCVDSQSYPILGSVYDKEIRNIDIETIPLCKNCRSGQFVVEKELRKYSKSLELKEKEKLLWEKVKFNTKIVDGYY